MAIVQSSLAPALAEKETEAKYTVNGKGKQAEASCADCVRHRFGRGFLVNGGKYLSAEAGHCFFHPRISHSAQADAPTGPLSSVCP